MVYKCGICNTNFKDVYKYNRHINRKNPCDPEIKKHLNVLKLTCEYCGKQLASKYSLNNHLTICIEKEQTNPQKLKEIIGQLKETMCQQTEKMTQQMYKQSIQMNKQSNQIEQLIKKEEKSNITITNNNVTQTQNVYGLIPFGKENLDFLTLAQYDTIFSKGCRAIQYLVELVHCDKNRPENMNIYISNYKDKYIRTFNGDEWTMENKNDVLYNLFHSKRDLLEFKYKDLKKHLSSDAKYYFGKMYFENGTTDEAIKIIKEDIKGLLYNNRLSAVKKPPKKPTKQSTKQSTASDLSKLQQTKLKQIEYLQNEIDKTNEVYEDVDEVTDTNNPNDYNYIPNDLIFVPINKFNKLTK